MPVDFSDFFDDGDEPPIHPRDIFLTLNRRPDFSFPRDIQTEVMNRWSDSRDANQDTIIKLNVGSGKTLIGLLLLQSSLAEKKGPALYVTPDKQLSTQVVREAEALGLDVTDDPRDPRYASGEITCVVNVYRLFNGKSVFGFARPPVIIGTVVIDDAHACVSTIIDQYRITLPNTHPAYAKVLAAVAEDLRGYSPAAALDIMAGDPRARSEIPYWSWNQHQNMILEALHEHRDDRELEFSYPLLRDLLPFCRCVLGGQRLEIEPPFPAADLISGFRRARRRVYMTATLADDSVLITHFGADQAKLAKPIVPTSSQSLGERMILMPQELNPDIDLPALRGMLVTLASEYNVVVIVPSEAASEAWKSDADQVLIGERVIDGIARLRSSHIGLTVLVNRYDGIDLPGDACRVLVIAGLPEVTSFSDALDSEILSSSAANLRRQIERIEQGMGRGVRSNDDYCAVILMGSLLLSRLRSPEGQAMLTPGTRAQLELSRRLARRLGTPSISDIQAVIVQCLGRDPDWVKAARRAILKLEADDVLRLDPSKLAAKKAFDFARANRPSDAVAVLDIAINEVGDSQIKAWLLMRKACFQHDLDASGAQKTLAAAHDLEPAVTKPLRGTLYKKLSPSLQNQALTLISYHQRRFVDPTAMILFADGLCSELQFTPETSAEFEAALHDLALFLGIAAQRPEKELREGPDNLWALPGGTYLVIECKNGVTSEGGIAKKDVGQLGQAIDWFNARYLTLPSTPMMVHPEVSLSRGASLLPGMRVISVNQLDKLRRQLRSLTRQLAQFDVLSSAQQVAKRLAQFEFSAETFVQGYSIPVGSI